MIYLLCHTCKQKDTAKRMANALDAPLTGWGRNRSLSAMRLFSKTLAEGEMLTTWLHCGHGDAERSSCYGLCGVQIWLEGRAVGSGKFDVSLVFRFEVKEFRITLLDCVREGSLLGESRR